MFWKEKTKAVKRFGFSSSCRRSSVRVHPPEDLAVILSIGNIRPDVKDISASGISFLSIESIDPNTVVRACLELPLIQQSVWVDLAVLRVEENLYTCSFEGMLEETIELMHHWVLKIQKEIARRSKGHKA